MKIVNFGSCNIDCVYAVRSIVRPGETVSSFGLQQFPGGKGLNQSLAMARAGLAVCHAGAIGEDGLFLKELLQESGADTTFLRVIAEKTGHAIIQIDETGENSILLYGGANQAISAAFIDEVLATMERGDVLVLQNEISNLLYLVKQAVAKGLRLFLNPSPLGRLQEEIDLHDFTGLVLNEIEAESLFGSADPDAVKEILACRYPTLLTVITLGKKGCLCLADGQMFRAEAFPVKAVDTTGAGDTFTGYFLAAYLQTADAAYAIRLASAAAALSVTVNGAASSIPKREDVERFLKEQSL